MGKGMDAVATLGLVIDLMQIAEASKALEKFAKEEETRQKRVEKAFADRAAQEIQTQQQVEAFLRKEAENTAKAEIAAADRATKERIALDNQYKAAAAAIHAQEQADFAKTEREKEQAAARTIQQIIQLEEKHKAAAAAIYREEVAAKKRAEMEKWEAVRRSTADQQKAERTLADNIKRMNQEGLRDAKQAQSQRSESAFKPQGFVSMGTGGISGGIVAGGSASLALAGVVMAGTAAIGVLSELAGVYVSVGKAALESMMAFDGVRASLVAITGSQQAAAKEFEYVKNAAMATAIPIQDAAKQYSRMLASAGDNVKLQEGTKKAFEGVSVAARVLNLSGEQVGGTLEALTQIMSKGKLQSEELRKQLGNRIPGAVRLAAEALYGSADATARLEKDMKAGKITAEQFIGVFGDAIKKKYIQGLDQAMGSLGAQLALLGNKKDLLGDMFGSKFLGPAAAEALKGISQALSEVMTEWEQFAKTQDGMDLQQAFKDAGREVGKLGAAMIKAFSDLAQSEGFKDTLRLVGWLAKQGSNVLGKGDDNSVAYWAGKATKMAVQGSVLGASSADTAAVKALQELESMVKASELDDFQREAQVALNIFLKQYAPAVKKTAEVVKELSKEEERAAKKRLDYLDKIGDALVKAMQSESELMKVEMERLGITDKASQGHWSVVKSITALYESLNKNDLSKPLAALREFKNETMLGITSGKTTKYSGDTQAFGMRQDISRKFGKDVQAESQLAWLVAKGWKESGLNLQTYNKAVEQLSRQSNDAYRLMREGIEDVGMAFGEYLVDRMERADGAWKKFGLTVVQMLEKMIVKLLIIDPLMKGMAGEGWNSGWGNLMKLFGPGSGSGGGITTNKLGSGEWTTGANPSGGTQSSVVVHVTNTGAGTQASVQNAGAMGRDLEQAIVGVMVKQRLPGGMLFGMR